MKKQVGILGHFSFSVQRLNGQTVKTHAVAKVVQERFGAENVVLKDTAGGAICVPRMLKDCVMLACNCRQTVLLPAQKGIRFFVPLLSLFGRKRLHLVTVGSWLPVFLKKKRFLTFLLKGFGGIYTETPILHADLAKMGFKNLFFMPNFKPFELPLSAVKQGVGTPVSLCTFSRVRADKGVTTAVRAVQLADKMGEKRYRLTVFGEIAPDYKTEFSALQKECSAVLRYGGTVPFDQTVRHLAGYDALLFPTQYAGEGMAGTFLDAYAAGLPIIASDFKTNALYTDLLVPAADEHALAKKIVHLFEQDDVLKYRRESLKKAERYSAAQSASILLANLRENSGKKSI